MRILRDSSEDEMVFEFLAAELHSGLFGNVLKHCLRLVGADRSLLHSRNLDDSHANNLRRAVLSCYRGYLRDDYLFIGFPGGSDWKLVEVSVEELGGFYYAASPGVQEWADISKGSRLVRDGAKYIDDLPADNPNRTNLAEIEKRLETGCDQARLIAVAKEEPAAHVLMEGHKRATAYVRRLDPAVTVEVVVGYNPHLDSWAYALADGPQAAKRS